MLRLAAAWELDWKAPWEREKMILLISMWLDIVMPKHDGLINLPMESSDFPMEKRVV